MSDFSDRPFVAGSLVGLRAFAVDPLGRLVGPSYPQIFTPGDNEAECKKDPYSESMYLTFRSMQESLVRAYYTPPPTPPPPKRSFWHIGGPTSDTPPSDHSIASAAVEKVKAPEKPKHSLAGLDCHCGFYAYFDGRNDYKQPSNVAAIIEGFGVCTVGTRGFRASKARLVAIVVPGKNFPEAKFSRVVHNYPDVPLYTSRRKAIEAHPLTAPEVPTPETCDDFWTRSAR